MQNKKLTIRQIVSYINNEEAEGGGFWLPNIQRPFVWNEEQMAKLFDSIMREYPISTLLIWKTRENVRNRKFIDHYHGNLKLTDFPGVDGPKSKLLVLDGQQRLQSLFIGLRGSRDGRQLYLDVLSGESTAAPEDIRFRFAFLKAPTWPWVRFRDIVDVTNKIDSHIAKEIAARSPEPLTDTQREAIELNVGKARKEFVNDSNITYQELDGIDNPDAYTLDDIVEIFIRANSGGTKLSKSDLLFSLLTSSWDDADAQVEALLEDLNQHDFAFDRDFVLKACLTMLGKGARYEVAKFRDPKTKVEMIQRWPELSEAIRAVRDFVVSKTYIRSDRALPSYQPMIPLIYLRFHHKKEFQDKAVPMVDYLLRTLVASAFSGSPDNLIDKIVRSIEQNQGFVAEEVKALIRADGRNLDITPAAILGQKYGSRGIHLLFNLWYPGVDYSPALGANGPEVDHIFPQSLLKTVKKLDPETGKKNLLRYRAADRDQIANCMLLTAEENGFSGKSDTPPDVWFSRSRFTSDEEHTHYLNLHLIPNDPSLWQLDRYDDFIEARKQLILRKFEFMLQKSEGLPAVHPGYPLDLVDGGDAQKTHLGADAMSHAATGSSHEPPVPA